MSNYTDEELRVAVRRRIDADKEVEDAIIEAIKRRRRGWLVNLVIDVAQFIFGRVVADIIERVVDWFFDHYS